MLNEKILPATAMKGEKKADVVKNETIKKPDSKSDNLDKEYKTGPNNEIKK